jgi:hypothetical protein
MRICSKVPARRGTGGDGTDVHRALRAAGPWGPVREVNEPLPTGGKGVDTAEDAGAVHARCPRGLCYGS